MTEKKRRPVWLYVLGAIGLILALSVIGIATSSGSPPQSTQDQNSQAPTDTLASTPARVSGQLPAIQYVGQTTAIRLTVQNGTSDLPHLVVDASGCMDHWVLDSMTSNVGAGHDVATGVYDFGPLLNGALWRGTLTVTPKDAGNHDCDIAVYGDLDTSTGTPKGDPLDTLTGKVAINP